MARTKLQKIKSARRQRLVIFSTSIVVGVLALGLIVAYLPFLKIKKVEVTGTVVVKSVEVQKLVEAQLGVKKWGIIPTNHYFWYPADEIIQEVKKNFPRLNQIEANLDWPTGRLVIKVSERQPVLITCLLPEAKDCFFLDKNGEAYSRAPHFSSGVFLEWLATSSNREAPFFFASSSEVERLVTAQKLFKQVLEKTSVYDWRLPRVESLTDGDYVFSVQNSFSSSTKVLPWKILINNKNNPTDLALNLHTTLSSILSTTSTSTWPNLEYVDLRFGKKVFYKL